MRSDLHELVPNAVGYGGGGLMRENWEGSTKQICIAKKFLKQEYKARAENKKAFLQDERSGMIRDEEIKIILDRSFQYLVALMEFSQVGFWLQALAFAATFSCSFIP
jgi:hypothetical protein